MFPPSPLIEATAFNHAPNVWAPSIAGYIAACALPGPRISGYSRTGHYSGDTSKTD